MSPWTCTQYHNMNKHTQSTIPSRLLPYVQVLCVLYFPQPVEGGHILHYIIKHRNSYSYGALSIPIYDLWCVGFARYRSSSPEGLLWRCGKALWNRLVGTCQLLPRRTLLPADVALAISSVKSNQSSNKTKQAKPNHSSMCVTTV